MTMNVIHTHPLVVMSFNRPDYLGRFLSSLRAQQGADLENRPIFLFQDGSRNAFSGIEHGRPEDIEACIATFRDVFPGQPVFDSSHNLGVALNFDRAERYVFEDLGAAAAIFLEDDLILSPHYINIIDHMLATHENDARVGYVAAYGNHLLPLEKQLERLHCLEVMHHNWGFGLFRRHWLKMLPYLEEYLSHVRGKDYRLRSSVEIGALFSSWGFAAPATSQDAAKTLACCLTRTIKVNTVACFGHYIGERGLHMNPDEFRRRNYAGTEMVLDLVTDFEPLTESIYRSIRGDLLEWAGRSPGPGSEPQRVSDARKLFHKVNDAAGNGQMETALEAAACGVGKLFETVADRNRNLVSFQPRAEMKTVESESHVQISFHDGYLNILCPKEMLRGHFTNYFNAFSLAADLLQGLVASAAPEGDFVMDLGNGSNVGSYKRVSFSSALQQAILVIDPDFYYSHAYAVLRHRLSRNWIPWTERKGIVYWRGNTTGIRNTSVVPTSNGPFTWSWLQRLLLCDRARKSIYASRLDVGLTRIVQISEQHLQSAIQDANFILGTGDETDLLDCRYAFVVDGNSSAGNGLYQALLAGSCVLLVGSTLGYKSWFYDRLSPWHTHVPIESDLSDMEEKLEWIFNNEQSCRDIAEHGRNLALKMTFETEREQSISCMSALFSTQ